MLDESFKLGPFVIYYYGLIIAFSIAAGYFLAKKRTKLYRIPSGFFESPWLLMPLLLGVLGGRVYHVVDKWQFYQGDLWAVLDVRGGGLGIFGSLAGIFFGFWIAAKVQKVNFFKLLDLISPSIILGQGLGRIGNYINQEGFGNPTNLPWGVYIEIEKRPEQFIAFERFHPTFFYELILDLLIFAALLLFAKRAAKTGNVFGLYLILYGFSRFIVEFFRMDTALLLGVKAAHIFSLLAVFFGVLILAKLRVDKV